MEFTGERLVPTADGWDDLFFEHITRYRFAASLVKGKHVLDAGSGCGYGACHMARRGAQSVSGIDIASEAVNYAREHFKEDGLRFDTADVLDTGLETGSFDRIVSFEVFEHVERPDRFLNEMKRLLAPGGLFLVSTPNVHTYVAGGKDGENPFHVKEYSPDEFQELLEASFSVIELYAQTGTAGIGIIPCHTGEDRSPECHARLGLVFPPSESPWGEPAPPRVDIDTCSYMIAICAMEPIPADLLPSPEWYVLGESLSGRDADYQSVQELQENLISRTRWVEELQREIDHRDQTIRTLQAEFDDRSRWALELDAKVRELTSQIGKLKNRAGISP